MNKKEFFKVLKMKKMGINCLNYSFSQEGEDVIIDRLLDHKENGFYVDIGAHHPIRFSNTWKFYTKGWHGINVDAMPGIKEIFDKYRPNDINVEAAISDEEKKLTYYIMSDKALNTFDKSLVESCIKEGYSIVEEKEMVTSTVNDILETYLPPNQEIDFIDIDIEGMDYRVEESIDWKKWKPKIVLLECNDVNEKIEDIRFSNLEKSGYRMIAKSGKTCFYICE